MDQTCVFCQILEGALPASFVTRDDRVSVFMDIMPVNPGHLLVIPNEHHATLDGLPAETAEAMMRVAHRAARAIRRSSIAADGINLFLADGAAAGQEVFHAHLHVIPRLETDGFRIDPSYGSPPQRDTLDVQALAISDHY